MPVQNQKCDYCYPFVRCVCDFDFAINLGISILNYPRSSIFLLFYVLDQLILKGYKLNTVIRSINNF